MYCISLYFCVFVSAVMSFPHSAMAWSVFITFHSIDPDKEILLA